MPARSVTHSIYFAFQKPNRSRSRAWFYFQRTYNSISRSSRSKSRASVSAWRIPSTGNSDALSRIKIDSGLTEERAAKLRDRGWLSYLREKKFSSNENFHSRRGGYRPILSAIPFTSLLNREILSFREIEKFLLLHALRYSFQERIFKRRTWAVGPA